MGLIALGGFVGAVVQVANQGGTPSLEAAAIQSQLQGLLVGVEVAAVIGLIAQLVIVYRVAGPTARRALWAGFGRGVMLSIITYQVIASQIPAVVQQVFMPDGITTQPLMALSNQLQVRAALQIVPDLLFAYAYASTRDRLSFGTPVQLGAHATADF